MKILGWDFLQKYTYIITKVDPFSNHNSWIVLKLQSFHPKWLCHLEIDINQHCVKNHLQKTWFTTLKKNVSIQGDSFFCFLKKKVFRTFYTIIGYSIIIRALCCSSKSWALHCSTIPMTIINMLLFICFINIIVNEVLYKMVYNGQLVKHCQYIIHVVNYKRHEDEKNYLHTQDQLNF
jgi:hypothetical protein